MGSCPGRTRPFEPLGTACFQASPPYTVAETQREVDRITERLATTDRTPHPAWRWLILASVVLLGPAVQACGGDDATAPVGPGDGGAIEVVHDNFTFEPDRMVFDVGETVEFTLVSHDIPHTFTVRDLGIDWEVSKEPQTQTFTFGEAGTFKLICAVPGHEGSGMVGTVEVR